MSGIDDEIKRYKSRIVVLEREIVKLTESTEKIGFTSMCRIAWGAIETICVPCIEPVMLHRLAFHSTVATRILIRQARLGNRIIFENVPGEAYTDPGALFPDDDWRLIAYPSIYLQLTIENQGQDEILVSGWVAGKKLPNNCQIPHFQIP